MKKNYTTPRAERLNFDYAKVVVASGDNKHGDKGQKWGCERAFGWGNCGVPKPENGRNCW